MTVRALTERNETIGTPATEHDPRWRSVVARDRAADGTFWYSVRTTGVYCVPSCPARLPKPANVRFHDTTADAERLGFRACRRCGGERTSARARTRRDHLEFAIGRSSIGLVLVAQSAKGVTAVLLGDDADALRGELARRFPRATVVERADAVGEMAERVVRFVESPSGVLDLLLDLRGTAFQRRVWAALREIPTGATASYAEVAARIGEPAAARAVAQACASNPAAVVVPCHRVVASDGSIAGYRWGVERKRALLAREASAESAA